MPLIAVLGESPEAAIGLTGLAVYRAGVTLSITIALQTPPAKGSTAFDQIYEYDDDPHDGRGLLLFSLTFADGRTVTTVDHPNLPAAEQESVPESLARPIIRRLWGSNVNLRLDLNYWLTPVPSPGPLTVTTSWPAKAIDTRTVTIDTTAVLAAAAASPPAQRLTSQK